MPCFVYLLGTTGIATGNSFSQVFMTTTTTITVRFCTKQNQFCLHPFLLAFSPSHLAHAFELSIKTTKQLCQYWSTKPSKPQNVAYQMSNVTLDVIGHMAFSQDFQSVASLALDGEENENYNLFDQVGLTMTRRMNQPKVPGTCDSSNIDLVICFSN